MVAHIAYGSLAGLHAAAGALLAAAGADVASYVVLTQGVKLWLIRRGWIWARSRPWLRGRQSAGNGASCPVILVQCVGALCAARLPSCSAPRPADSAVADLRGDLEALAVVGALLVEQLIGGRGAVFALGQLLQHRLVVAARLAPGGQLDFRADVPLDELAGRPRSPPSK